MLNVNSLLSTILQGSIELPPSILNRMIIRIDYYDQSRFGFSPSATVVAYFVDKRFPHPTFGVPLAEGERSILISRSPIPRFLRYLLTSILWRSSSRTTMT